MPQKAKTDKASAAAKRHSPILPRKSRAPSAYEEHLDQGLDALARAAWEEARAAFGAALRLQETPEALEGLGAAAWWQDDPTAVFEARERAYSLYRKRGDNLGAARLATELAEDCVYFNGEPAVANGWLRRAQRLLAAIPTAPEHGWLKLIEGDIAMFVRGDPATARRCAREAQAVARAFEFTDLEMLGLSLEGLALVTEGHLHDGMPFLDEAAAAAVSGDMKDPLAIGFTCCYLITACERARDFERASQWCQRVEQFTRRTRFHTLFAVCRIQYAGVLLWRGEWQAAERELLRAAQTLATTHPALRLDGIVRLAELRRRQGRHDEARRLLDAAAAHPRAALERAALALEEGDDPRVAVALAERFLRGVPSANRTEAVAGLDVLLRAQLALGNAPAARATQRAMRKAAAAASTPALRAAARLADARLAAHAKNLRLAHAAFEDAIDLLGQSGAAYEQAQARLELACALPAGDPQGEREARAAVSVFERLGAQRASDRARRLLEAPAAGRSARAGGLTARETEIVRLVAQGMSNPGIAAKLGLSEFTVKRHVANILTKLDLPSRAAAAAHAARANLLR